MRLPSFALPVRRRLGRGVRLAAILVGAVLLGAPLVAWAEGGPQDDSLNGLAPVYRVAVVRAHPPFSHRDAGGALTGFNVAIAREICQALAVTCVIEERPMRQIADEVAAGRFEFALANFLRTPEREARLAFSVPYWRSSSSLIGPIGDAARSGLEGLGGHAVVVVDGTRQHDFIQRRAGEPVEAKAGGVQPVGVMAVGDMEAVWAALRGGRARFALVPTLASLGFLTSVEGRRFAVIGQPLVEAGLGGTVHIVMPKGRADLKAAIDAAILAIRADGSYQAVRRRYFSFDIY